MRVHALASGEPERDGNGNGNENDVIACVLGRRWEGWLLLLLVIVIGIRSRNPSGVRVPLTAVSAVRIQHERESSRS